MEIHEEGERINLSCSLNEVKEIYRALFHVLRSGGGDQFDESDILINLQLFLQQKAREAGVDATVHMDWERFLGYDRPTPCEERYANYRPGTNGQS